MNQEIVYLLWHEHEVEGCDHTKLLGVFSEERLAQDAMERMKDQPGFRDEPNGLTIAECIVNRDWWPEGFVSMC